MHSHKIFNSIYRKNFFNLLFLILLLLMLLLLYQILRGRWNLILTSLTLQIIVVLLGVHSWASITIILILVWVLNFQVSKPWNLQRLQIAKAWWLIGLHLVWLFVVDLLLHEYIHIWALIWSLLSVQSLASHHQVTALVVVKSSLLACSYLTQLGLSSILVRIWTGLSHDSLIKNWFAHICTLVVIFVGH